MLDMHKQIDLDEDQSSFVTPHGRQIAHEKEVMKQKSSNMWLDY